MKRLLVLLVVSCGGPKFNWPEFRVAQTPTAAEALGQNALVLQATDTLTFDGNDDGVSATLTRYRRIKIFTQDGVRAAEVHLPFSARMNLLSFDGRTRVQDGINERTIKASLDEIVVKRPIEGVKDFGEAVFTLPSAAPGAVLEYFASYEIPDALLIEPVVMRDRFSALRSELVVIAPKSMDLDLRYLVGGLTKPNSPIPATAPRGDQVAYRYVEQDLAPLIAEEFGPAPSRMGPAVWPVYRGMRSGKGLRMERWEDVGEWLRKRMRLAPATGAEVDSELLQTAFQTEALKMHVTDHGLKLGETATRSDSDRIGAGFALYDAMAARGFKVGLGLVSRESAGLVLPEVPNPSMFDAVVVAVPASGKVIYFDPACPSCPVEQVSQGLEGATVVAVFSDSSRIDTLPTREPKDNAYSITLSSKIGSHGEVSGTAQVVLSGAPAAMARGSFLRKESQALAHDLGFADAFEASNLTAPEGSASHLTFETAFDFRTQCKEEGGARLRCGVGNAMDRVLPELWREARTHDLIVPSTFQHQVVASYQIPPKAAVELPPAMTAKSKFGEYSLTYQSQPGQLTFSRRFVLSARRVASDEYDDFYKFLQQVRQYDTVMPLVDLYPPEDVAKPVVAPEPDKKAKKKKKGKK